jgi:hypothetical protein
LPLLAGHTTDIKESESNVIIADDHKVINQESIEKKDIQSIKDVMVTGFNGQFIYNSVSKELASFVGLCGEKYFSNPLFSHYGSLAYGFSGSGSKYVKLPVIGLFLLSASSFLSLVANKNLYFSWEKYLIDGFALNYQIGDVFYLSPYLGLVTAFSISSIEAMLGIEGGLKVNFFIGQRLRATVAGGTYYNFMDDSFTYNANVSFGFLIGK